MMKFGSVKMVNTAVVSGATVIATISFIPTQHHIVGNLSYDGSIHNV